MAFSTHRDSRVDEVQSYSSTWPDSLMFEDSKQAVKKRLVPISGQSHICTYNRSMVFCILVIDKFCSEFHGFVLVLSESMLHCFAV